MNTIVNEELVSFKELEKKIYSYVCELAREITQQMLESYDEELAKSRDKKVYRGKGKRKTSIKTVYGEVEYSRNVYRTETEDELGSGMRGTYKYTRLYSGGTPKFIENDVFRTIIPLVPVAVEKVGPQEKAQVTTQVTDADKILVFCHEPHSKAEIAEHCGYKNTKNFTQRYFLFLTSTSL